MVDKYRVQSDGRVFGPFTAERLVDLLVDGKVGEDALVCPQGETEWVPWSSVPALGGSAEQFAASEANPPVFSPGPPGPPARANSPRVIKHRKMTLGVARLKSQTVAGGQDGDSNAGGKHTNMVVVIAVAIALLVGVGFGILFRTEKSNDPPIAESYGNVIANKTDDAKNAAKPLGPENVREAYPASELKSEPKPEPKPEQKPVQKSEPKTESTPRPKSGLKLRKNPPKMPAVATTPVVARRLKLKDEVTARGTKQRLMLSPEQGPSFDPTAGKRYLPNTAYGLKAFGPIAAWLSKQSKAKSQTLKIVDAPGSDEAMELGHITIGKRSGQLELAINGDGSLDKFADALRLSCIVVSSKGGKKAFAVDALNDTQGNKGFEQGLVPARRWKNKKWINSTDGTLLEKASRASGQSQVSVSYRVIPTHLTVARERPVKVIQDGTRFRFRVDGAEFKMSVVWPESGVGQETTINVLSSQKVLVKSDVYYARKLASAVNKIDKTTLARFGLPLLTPDAKSGSKDRVKKFRGLIKRLVRVEGVFLNNAVIDVSDLSWKSIKGKANKKAPIPRAYFQSIGRFCNSIIDVSKNASKSAISKFTNAAMGCTVHIRYEVPGAIYLVPYKRYGEGGR